MCLPLCVAYPGDVAEVVIEAHEALMHTLIHRMEDDRVAGKSFSTTHFLV